MADLLGVCHAPLVVVLLVCEAIPVAGNRKLSSRPWGDVFDLIDRSRVLLRLVLAVCHWSPHFSGLVYVGDNVGSLQLALSGRVRGALGAFYDDYLAGISPTEPSDLIVLPSRVREGLGALARELFVRKAREQWFFGVSHLASEANVLADALSRLAQPGTSSSMPSALVGASELASPKLEDLWSL